MTDLIQIAVLSAIAISCGILGPFLVLKKMAMFANSLSHTILLGIVVAFLLTGSFFSISSLLIGALFAAFVTAFFTGMLIRVFRLQEDASIGLVFTALFALGITFVTLFTRNVHLGIEAVMGNADVVQMQDLKTALTLAFVNVAAICLFYRQFQIGSFDGNLAKVLKVPFTFFHFLLLFLVSITCIGAFRAVGVILVLTFLVGPFLTARIFCHRLPWLLFFSPLIGVVASIAGVMISRFLVDAFDLSLSTAGIVASLIGIIYLVTKWAVSFKMSKCEKTLPSSEVPDPLGKAP